MLLPPVIEGIPHTL